MTLNFAVMSGAGNTFSVVDNRLYGLSVDDGRRLAPVLCSAAAAGRTTEGLMLIGAPVQSGTDFHMDFFNPDGSWGAMCGNGGRCAVRFAADIGLVTTQGAAFTVLDTLYTARINGETVQLRFPPARAIQQHCTLSLGGAIATGLWADVGSDHIAVHFSDIAHITGGDFDTFDIARWGAALRHHPAFAPRGVNANFYTILPDGTVRLRTFERGVEAETGACGTGALSTALAVVLRHGLLPPVRIIPSSGSPLTVDFARPVSAVSALSLEGNAIVLGTQSATLENWSRHTP